MRISDWSSDVCSSDLDQLVSGIASHVVGHALGAARHCTIMLALRRARFARLGEREAGCAKTPRTDRIAKHVAIAMRDGDVEMAGILCELRSKSVLTHLRRHSIERSEEHTSELQSLMRISYAVFCLKKKNNK